MAAARFGGNDSQWRCVDIRKPRSHGPYPKANKRYPSDLTDEAWAAVAPLLPAPARRGRKRCVDLREILNAIRQIVRSGCECRMLPVHFPPWQTVYWWFRTLRAAAAVSYHPRRGFDDQPRARRPGRAAVRGHSGQPDDQGVGRGRHAELQWGKRIVGRKRHIAVDTEGRLLMVNLTTANIADSTGAQAVLEALRKRWPWIKHLFADGAHDKRQILDKADFLNFVLDIVRRMAADFKILPRRWVVERTFALMTRYRRPCARLRGADRRLRGLDLRRHEKPAGQEAFAPVISKRPLRSRVDGSGRYF